MNTAPTIPMTTTCANSEPAECTSLTRLFFRPMPACPSTDFKSPVSRDFIMEVKENPLPGVSLASRNSWILSRSSPMSSWPRALSTPASSSSRRSSSRSRAVVVCSAP